MGGEKGRGMWKSRSMILIGKGATFCFSDATMMEDDADDVVDGYDDDDMKDFLSKRMSKCLCGTLAHQRTNHYFLRDRLGGLEVAFLDEDYRN